MLVDCVPVFGHACDLFQPKVLEGLICFMAMPVPIYEYISR